MKAFVQSIAAVCLALGVAAPHATIAATVSAADEVIQAERDFDAYTHLHGYTHGFYAFSAPDAVAYSPGPVRIHDILGAALMKDALESDAPSKLRWWPGRVGVAASGELAYDLGGWKVGDDKSGWKTGWFLTIWQKQANGRWLWRLDNGSNDAGVSTSAPAHVMIDSAPAGNTASPMLAASEIHEAEQALNSALHDGPALIAYADRLTGDAALLSDNAAPADIAEDIKASLAQRPADLTWELDSDGVSTAGDFAYAYGHASDIHGIRGYYVRLWRKDGTSANDWRIVADIFHPVAAKP